MKSQFSELIKKRRSTRKYTDQLLSSEQVEMILKAGLLAPSSKMSTPWEFIVIEEKEMLKQLAASKEHGASFLEGCAMAVVVTANVMTSDVWIEDASIASIFMQLQAEELGLGSCWCQIRSRVTAAETDSNEYLRGLLDIPYQMDILSIIGFGHKAQERKPAEEGDLKWEKVHIGKFSMRNIEPDNE